MIHIALDTSILHKEGLGSKNMRLLTRLVLADELVISVPEMVAREFVSKCVADGQEKLSAAHVVLSDLRKKLGKGEGVADELAKVVSETTRIRDGLAATINREFEAWINASKVTLLKFDPTHIEAVLDGYFNGTGPYKRSKSREDIPDAIISCCIVALAAKQSPLHVAVGDGRFYQHLTTIEGIRPYKELSEFFQSAEVSRIVVLLDQAQGTAAFRDFLLSERFSSRIQRILNSFGSILDSVYVEEEEILNPAALDFPSAFGLTIDGSVSMDLHSVKCNEVTNTGPGQFVIEVELRAAARLRFCAGYGELLALPDARQMEIEQGSMDGEGICDLSEVIEVLLRGQLSFEFDGQLDAAALDAKFMSPAFDFSTAGVELNLFVETAEILPPSTGD